MRNRQWTQIFHAMILMLIIITVLLVAISGGSVQSKHESNLNDHRDNYVYRSIHQLSGWSSNSSNISHDELTIFNHIINEDMTKKYIVFPSYHSYVYAYIIDDNGNEEIIYELSSDGLLNRSVGTNTNMIYVPDDSEGKTISIRIIGCYESITYTEVEFLYGEKYDFLLYYFNTDKFNIILDLIMIIIAIMVCLVSVVVIIYRREKVDMMYLGLFLLTFSMWSISGSYVLEILLQQPIKILYTCYISLYLTPVFLLMYIRNKTYGNNIKKRTVTRIILVHLLLIALVELLQLFNIRDVRQTIFIVQLMILAEAVVVFRYTYYRFRIATKVSVANKTIPVIALSLTLISVVYTILQYTITSEVDPLAISIVLVIYIGALVADSFSEIWNDIMTLHKNVELRTIAYTDELTHIKNRNAFISDTRDMKLDNITVITFDLNSLKYYNDNFGHDKGDKLLVGMASVLTDIFGERAYRVGGDEFHAIVESDDVDKLLVMFEREELKFNQSTKDGIILRAAYGYEEYDGNEEHNLQYMINKADEKMYTHKKLLKGLL